jgi:hypothetical protein
VYGDADDGGIGVSGVDPLVFFGILDAHEKLQMGDSGESGVV